MTEVTTFQGGILYMSASVGLATLMWTVCWQRDPLHRLSLRNGKRHLDPHVAERINAALGTAKQRRDVALPAAGWIALYEVNALY